MTEKEYFEKLKSNPKWDYPIYEVLFAVKDGIVNSVEGKWFRLKGPENIKARIVDTRIERKLLEMFFPKPTADYASLSQLKISHEDLKKITKDSEQPASNTTKEKPKDEVFINSASSTYIHQQVPKMPEKRLPKKSVEITIGLFFDGTGNNRYNTELVYNQNIDKEKLILDVKEIEKLGKSKNRTVKYPPNPKQNVRLTKDMVTDPASSFLNPYSNIVLLHDLYITNGYNKKLATSQKITFRQYVQGIGTLAVLDNDSGNPLIDGYNEDDIYGSASGRGKRGVIFRVEEGIENAVRQISKSLSGLSVEIRSLTFDVFGFSRGATAARHFVNEILKPEVKEGALGLDENGKTVYLPFQPKAGKLGESLIKYGFTVPQKIEIRVTGLFETVITDSIERGLRSRRSLELPEWRTNPENVVYEKMQGYEEIFTSLQNHKSKVMHIVGMDEYRYNFPLTICDAPNLYEMYLYGSHSDIGGGYAEMDYNTIIDFKDIRNNDELLEYHKIRDSYRKRFAYGFSKQSEKFVYYKGQIEVEKLAPHIENKYSDRRGKYPGPPTKIDHYVLKDRRFISNKISLVSLNAMLEYALLQGVPFERDLDKANVPNKKFYHLPKDPYFMDYYKWVHDSVKDPNNNRYKPKKEIYQTLYNRYIHISSNFNQSVLYGSEGTETGPGDVYVNQPMPEKKRAYLQVRVPKPRKF